jgi:hypothetical protein
VKSAQPTYQSIRKITAFLLLLSFLIPSGLQAKQLAEFCMPDHHEDMGMMADHSCCETQPTDENRSNHDQNHCEEVSLCTCNITVSVPGEEEFLQPVKKQIIQPSETELQTPLFSEDQTTRKEFIYIPSGNDIPLWLMFDTFLM